MTSAAARSLFLLAGARPRDPAVTRWLDEHGGALGAIATHWLKVLRGCGADVREILHDGRPTVCVGGAAFAYVDVFRAHASVGFFRGAELADPVGLLEGSGRRMRHVKLTASTNVDESALSGLIYRAYEDIRHQLEADAGGAA